MTAPDPARQVDFDALLAHRAWVRALARRLVSDPARADDVEQETWRRAIERPPSHAGSLRAWLSAVARNAARGIGRGETRRARREAAAPPPRSTPRPDDVVAEAELQHRLVAEVLALEEPYRATVLHRWFEGLSAREIAERQGVPVATVRTRLQRAVERLRERMNSRLGDDREAWCLLLLGARGDGVTAPQTGMPLAATAAASGGLVMGIAAKMAIGAAAVALSAVVVWTLAHQAEDDGAATRDTAARSVGAPSAAGPRAAERVDAATAPEPAAAPGADPAPSAGTLIVETRSLRDEPVEGATVELRRAVWGEDPMRRRPDARGSTDASGTSVFRRLAAGAWHVVARTPASADASATAYVTDPGPEQRVRLALEPGHELRGTVRDESGAPIEGAVFFSREGRAVSGAHGEYALKGLPSGEIALRVGRSAEFTTLSVVVAVPDVAVFDIVLTDYDTVTVTGVVVDDATSAPLEGAVVDNVVRHAGSSPACVTGADGRFRLPGVLREQLALMTVKRDGYRTFPAGKPARTPPPGDVIDLGELRMQHGATVEGTVSSPEGPIEGAEVILVAPSRFTGRSQTRAKTDASGRFEFASVEAGAAQLHVSAPGFVERTPGSNYRSVDLPEKGSARAEFVLAKGGTASGRVVDSDGNGVPGAYVAGGVQCQTDGDGRFRMIGLTPASSVRIWTMAVGYTSGEQTVYVGAEPVTGVMIRVERTASVHGRLVAVDGRAVENPRVFVVAAQPRARRDPSRIAGDENAAGPFPVRADGTFEGQAPYSATEAFSVVVLTKSHAPARIDPVALVTGQKEYRVELPLTAGMTVRGRVIADGRGVAGAAVTLGEAGYGYTVPPVRAVTDASGAFAIERVPSFSAGKVLVTASRTGYVDAEADAVADAEMELVLQRPLEISGVIETRDRAPAADAYVTAEPVDVAAPSSRTIPRKSFAFTDAEGRFRIAGLRAGTYRIVVTPGRGTTPAGDAVAAGTSGLRLVLD